MDQNISHWLDSLPKPAAARLIQLYTLILTVAEDHHLKVTESIKWGHPSFSTGSGQSDTFWLDRKRA